MKDLNVAGYGDRSLVNRWAQIPYRSAAQRECNLSSIHPEQRSTLVDFIVKFNEADGIETSGSYERNAGRQGVEAGIDDDPRVRIRRNGEINRSFRSRG
jgi:hypothetical protein